MEIESCPKDMGVGEWGDRLSDLFVSKGFKIEIEDGDRYLSKGGCLVELSKGGELFLFAWRCDGKIRIMAYPSQTCHVRFFDDGCFLFLVHCDVDDSDWFFDRGVKARDKESGLMVCGDVEMSDSVQMRLWLSCHGFTGLSLEGFLNQVKDGVEDCYTDGITVFVFDDAKGTFSATPLLGLVGHKDMRFMYRNIDVKGTILSFGGVGDDGNIPHLRIQLGMSSERIRSLTLSKGYDYTGLAKVLPDWNDIKGKIARKRKPKKKS